ncbi:glycosyltransferase family 2 protein [Phaeobacter porticola]|uniref:Glycosyltransferase involved in cell wall biogenesis n=1 Tax=Phaeobacter porticola TaxID=1844006 RepID=A0A1L3IA09_9RHOB|nr:glycosyltransferase [Phaeobacter porticola]APG48916.1 Glycosyltransferase involved in cell wall biogenesis [Phaeobacter porticola]
MQEPVGQGPLISIIMANHQGAAYLKAALHSVLAQTYANWELIFADDASRDGSQDIMREAAKRDNRVRVLLHDRLSGPAAARNRALASAQGDWLAICDSDDVMHPDRLRRLVAAAEKLGADAVADDMIHFATEPLATPRSVLGTDMPDQPRKIGPVDMLRVPEPGERSGQLGYLKPLISRSALGALRYDEGLQIGEDQDLYLRFLMQGAQMWVLPEALYLYRRHPASLSYRSSHAQVAAAVAAMEALRDRLMGEQDVEIEKILLKRHRVLQGRLRFETLVEHLKKRRFAVAVLQLLRRPSLILRLAQIITVRARAKAAGDGARKASKQAVEVVHLVGPNGVMPKCVSGRCMEVPDPVADVGYSDLWAELCQLASRTTLTLTYGDAAGLSAAWRVPAAVHILARCNVASELPPPPQVIGDD